MFILPYLAAMLLYTLEISYLVEEMELGGNIEEPEIPEDVMDLSDVTMCQSALFFVATPFILVIQLYDLCVALYKALMRYLEYRKAIYEEKEARRNKKKRNVCSKMLRTCFRCYKTIKYE